MNGSVIIEKLDYPPLREFLLVSIYPTMSTPMFTILVYRSFTFFTNFTSNKRINQFGIVLFHDIVRKSY